MFERYTELARRTIFFARYEASVYGSVYIQPEHLLLGILREDKLLAAKLPMATAKRHIEARLSPPFEKISTSVDLPLNEESKRALHYAAEEATALQDHFIDTAHMALGLLRVETSFAAEILRSAGIDAAAIRGMRRPPPRPLAGVELFPAVPLNVESPLLTEILLRYRNVVEAAMSHLSDFDENAAEAPLKHRPWSRKEALGHLIDLSTAHHQWFARALTNPKISAAGYPDEDWIRPQKYALHPWIVLVETWVSLNTLLVRVLAHVPATKLETPCRIGIADPISLEQLIRTFVIRSTDLLGEILARG